MESIKTLCPFCEGFRSAHVICSREEPEEKVDIRDNLFVRVYNTLKCTACDTIYFQQKRFEIDESDNRDNEDFYIPLEMVPPEYIMSEETSYWPLPSKRKRPGWLMRLHDSPISLLGSIYTALDNDLWVLAAIGMRTVFDRAAEELGVDPSYSFIKKLDQLQEKGYIRTSQKEQLRLLTDAGSAAAHRSWEPTLEQLNILASIIEQFVHQHFMLELEVGRLKGSIPPRQGKPGSADRDQSGQLIEFHLRDAAPG
jgi:hypothetical protein